MQELPLNMNNLPFSQTAVKLASILTTVQKLHDLTITERGLRFYPGPGGNFGFINLPTEAEPRFYLMSYKFGGKSPALEFHPSVKRLVAELEHFGAVLEFDVNHSSFDAWFDVSSGAFPAYYCLSSQGLWDFELVSRVWCDELTSGISRNALLLDNMLYALVLWCGVPRRNDLR